MRGMARWLLLCCSFWLVLPVAAAEERPRYVVGVENIDYYPQFAFSYRGSYAEALLSAFAKDQKLDLLYNPLTVNRLYHELLVSKTIDFKYPDNPEWGGALKKGRKVYYSDGVSQYIDGVYVRPEALGRGLERLRTLGVVQGFTPVGYEERIGNGVIRVVEDTSLSNLLLMCLRGEIDGVYANMDLSHHWLTHTIKRPHGLVFDPGLPFVQSEYRLSTLDHPEVIERFNRFLREEEALLNKLRETYGIQDKSQLSGFR